MQIVCKIWYALIDDFLTLSNDFIGIENDTACELSYP